MSRINATPVGFSRPPVKANNLKHDGTVAVEVAFIPLIGGTFRLRNALRESIAYSESNSRRVISKGP
jgi:hypothetical protein